MLSINRRCLLTLLAVTLFTGIRTIAANEDQSEEPEKKQPFVVKFVAAAGRPIAGAIAGITAYYGDEGKSLPAVDATDWRYWLDAKSDADGIARFAEGGDFTHLCLVARHVERKLIGIEKVDPTKFASPKLLEPFTITLHPECRVSGRLTSSDLAQRNRSVGWTNTYLNFSGGRALGCQSKDQEFHFLLPPGEFTIDAYGADVHSIEKKLTVKLGQRELVLDTIDLPAKRLALLQGLPAPELVNVAGWKNGPARTLAELKGKVIILDFWGYWCGPCVHRMPELFQIYDKYHDQGLEIIGIHVDQGEDEQEPIDTPPKLDQKLTKIRKNLWKGRDVPYPVALITAKRVPYGPMGLTREARCQLSADYGITRYPTLVLIDRAGNVVDRIEPSLPADIARLEKLLSDK